MQTTVPTGERVKALAVQATEFKQHNDNCSGQSETWSELSLDKFAQMIVDECVRVIDQHCLAVGQGVVAQMPVAAEVGSGDERDELGSG